MDTAALLPTFQQSLRRRTMVIVFSLEGAVDNYAGPWRSQLTQEKWYSFWGKPQISKGIVKT